MEGNAVALFFEESELEVNWAAKLSFKIYSFSSFVSFAIRTLRVTASVGRDWPPLSIRQAGVPGDTLCVCLCVWHSMLCVFDEWHRSGTAESPINPPHPLPLIVMSVHVRADLRWWTNVEGTLTWCLVPWGKFLLLIFLLFLRPVMLTNLQGQVWGACRIWRQRK